MKRKIGYGWIHLLDTVGEIEKITSYILNSTNISIGSWVIIDGPIMCSNGRLIGSENKKNWAVLTTTFNKNPIKKMVKLGLLNWENTAELDELSSVELELADFGKKIKKAIYFENFSEFKKNIS